jgi:hypothetical protein
MNLTQEIEQFNEKNIYFYDPIKNNIMNEGIFIRIIYSTPTFSLNGINLNITLSNDIIFEKYYNKYKCFFNIQTHKKLIEQIHYIESNLLKKSNIKNKIPQFKVYEQLSSGNIKFFLENNDENDVINNNFINNKFILKISGIWETDIQYGLTYKFYILGSKLIIHL